MVTPASRAGPGRDGLTLAAPARQPVSKVRMVRPGTGWTRSRPVSSARWRRPRPSTLTRSRAAECPTRHGGPQLLLDPRPTRRRQPRRDYWLNFGPHLFPDPDTVLGRLVTELGLKTKPVTGSTLALFYQGKLLADDRTASYPARLPLSPSAGVSLLRAGTAIRRGVRDYSRLARPRPGETPAEVTRRLLAFEDSRTFADFLLGPLHAGTDSILRAASG